ncbi:hypothetical protein [Saccharopolyspora pogona]|uniref:hypothetical protein n=1 Tax=Saccharopolyspora pogona TaxID=333966 RepID=UPI001689DBDD|nr:hypothetical protein [Saccharopolyspora pogona]
MMHRSVRVLGSAVAVGAALLLSACGQQPPPPNLLQPGDIGQRPIVMDEPAASATMSKVDASAPETKTATTTKTTEQQPVPQQPAPVKQFYAATYVDGTNQKLVQQPSVFIHPNVTGESASEVKLMNLDWSKWGENGAVGYGSAYITGGGGPPETVNGVQLILDNPKMHNGKMQYTHYMIVWPQQDAPDEGQLHTL